jgi:hypothetical protein
VRGALVQGRSKGNLYRLGMPRRLEGGVRRRDTQCTGPSSQSVEKGEEILRLSERAPWWLPPSESPGGARSSTPRNLDTTENYRAQDEALLRGATLYVYLTLQRKRLIYAI